MKSTPDPRRASSAWDCSTAVRTGILSATAVPGASAKDSAAASERFSASRSLSNRAWKTSATTAPAISSTATTICRRST